MASEGLFLPGNPVEIPETLVIIDDNGCEVEIAQGDYWQYAHDAMHVRPEDYVDFDRGMSNNTETEITGGAEALNG